jgi:hypothetical protein
MALLLCAFERRVRLLVSFLELTFTYRKFFFSLLHVLEALLLLLL